LPHRHASGTAWFAATTSDSCSLTCEAGATIDFEAHFSEAKRDRARILLLALQAAYVFTVLNPGPWPGLSDGAPLAL
jgi:hypothetical protein